MRNQNHTRLEVGQPHTRLLTAGIVVSILTTLILQAPATSAAQERGPYSKTLKTAPTIVTFFGKHAKGMAGWQQVAKTGPGRRIYILNTNGTYTPTAWKTSRYNPEVAEADREAHRRQHLPYSIPNPADTGALPPLPTQAPKAGTWAYASSVNGQVAHWDHCQPITWTLDPEGLTPKEYMKEQTRWEGLMREIHTITSYNLTQVPPPLNLKNTIRPGHLLGDGQEQKWPDITVSYRGDKELPELHGNLGIEVGGEAQTRGSERLFKTAGIIINQDNFQNLPPLTQASVLRHELGHALGLGHTRNKNQVMDEQSPNIWPTWQDGDQWGLITLAQTGQPCE